MDFSKQSATRFIENDLKLSTAGFGSGVREYCQQIHHLHYDFICKFRDIENPECWKFSGPELLAKVQEYAKAHLELGLFSCVDRAGNNANLLLFPHISVEKFRGMDQFWGTNLYLFSKHREPTQIFLYPNNATDFIEALNYSMRPNLSARSIDIVNNGIKASFLRGEGALKWKYQGYDLMQKLEQFKLKHRVLRMGVCDDSLHASSLFLVCPRLVRDASGERQRKTWLIGVPQLRGEVLDIILQEKEVSKLVKHIKYLLGLNGIKSTS